MESKGYNGWANYETWCVKLWMDNEEGSYRHWQAASEEAWDQAEDDRSSRHQTRKQSAENILADRLLEEHEEAKPLVGGVFGDLLGAAMGEVDWHEIAGALLEDYKDEQEPS